MSFGVSALDGDTLEFATAATLARRHPFRLGATRIDPASREVSGPGGRITIEPRVMQVLVALASVDGGVVTREDLSRLCWNNQIVGDDALNRAVSEVRRLARTVAASEFVVETITRTGYRLTGATTPVEGPADTEREAAPKLGGVSRRLALGGAAVAVAGLAAGAWAVWPNPKARAAAALAQQAQLAADEGMPAGATQAVSLLRQAVALRPDDPMLWGQLAQAWRSKVDFALPADSATAVRNCELAAMRALSLDPKQADARTALIMLRATYGDWLAVEAALRGVLADRPDNDVAGGELAALLQSVGRIGEAGARIDHVAARRPLSPAYQYRVSLSLWSRGRLGDADRTIERAFALWPRHPGVWSARLWLTGFTGRASLALAQIADLESRPAGVTEEAVATLRTSMQALRTRAPAAIRAAVDANMAAAMTGASGSISAIMVLSGLGRLDEAFSIANGYLLRQGPSLMPLRANPAQAPAVDRGHRHTQVLFVPVSAPLRADPRFMPMCEGCGVGDYWRRSGHRPDFLG